MNPPRDGTAAAFIRTIDPNAGFATTNSVEEDTTAIPGTWDRYSIELAIDPGLVGQLLQFGYSSTASNFEAAGVFYDNILVEPAGLCTDGEPRCSADFTRIEICFHNFWENYEECPPEKRTHCARTAPKRRTCGHDLHQRPEFKRKRAGTADATTHDPEVGYALFMGIHLRVRARDRALGRVQRLTGTRRGRGRNRRYGRHRGHRRYGRWPD